MPVSLSRRETETLALIGRGHTSKEIAELLGLSVTTIAGYRRGRCRKLGLHTTASLAAHAARLGNHS
jgi:DNA-binding CsgD family transcriptional regulator